jgi:hypothetical protein
MQNFRSAADGMLPELLISPDVTHKEPCPSCARQEPKRGEDDQEHEQDPDDAVDI